MTLSNHTVKLPQSLQEVKRRNGMSSFIQFENAVIDFEPFQQLHPFESMSFVLAALRKYSVIIRLSCTGVICVTMQFCL